MHTVDHHEQELAAEPGSARVARTTVERVLGSVLDGDAMDRALLCTSEVVTNAVEHGHPPIALCIERVDPATVRIMVRDGSSAPPALIRSGRDAVRGRGIYIVDRCADRWGTTLETDRQGKVVWFELAVTDRR